MNELATFSGPGWELRQGDVLAELGRMEADSVHCVVTSPPYWGLRDYEMEGQIGLEDTIEEYVEKLAQVFEEVRRVLRPDGTLWLNMGDSYAGSWGNYGSRKGGQRDRVCGKHIVRAGYDRAGWSGRPPTSRVNRSKRMPRGTGRWSGDNLHRAPPAGLKAKDLIGAPWRVAFALQAAGWWLRSDIVWSKTNARPESAPDRPSRSHEYLFLMSKEARYSFATKMRGTVWQIATEPSVDDHYAIFPKKLVHPCVVAGSPVDGLVLDPFSGSGTTGVVTLGLGRRFIGIELNPDTFQKATRRLKGTPWQTQITAPEKVA